MRVDFGTAEFLGFIGVMIPAVFVLAGFVIAGMAFRFRTKVDASEWNEEQDLQCRSVRLVRQYLIFGGVLLAVFFVSSALEPSGVTWLIPASYAVVALAALLYFCRLLKRTYTFYVSITRMTVRKHFAGEVKVG